MRDPVDTGQTADEEPDIHRADPAMRRRAVVMVVAALLLGSPVVLLAQRQRGGLAAWLGDHAETLQQHPWIALVVGLVAMAPLLGFAVYLLRFGAAVVAAERFPPPDSRTVRDVAVRTGAHGVARGRALQGLAGMLLLACLAVPVLAWRVVVSLG